jgi:hypothetical protein
VEEANASVTVAEEIINRLKVIAASQSPPLDLGD